MEPPIITCTCCEGKGKHPLKSPILDTFTRIVQAAAPVKASDLIEPGISPNAINNRLRALHDAGLISRVGKQSKNILWAIRKGEKL